MIASYATGSTATKIFPTEVKLPLLLCGTCYMMTKISIDIFNQKNNYFSLKMYRKYRKLRIHFSQISRAMRCLSVDEKASVIHCKLT